MLELFFPPYILVIMGLYVIKNTWQKKIMNERQYGIDGFGLHNCVIFGVVLLTIYSFMWFVQDYLFDVGFYNIGYSVDSVKKGVSNLMLMNLFGAIIPQNTYKKLQEVEGISLDKILYFVGNIGLWLMVYVFFEQWFLSRYGTHLIPTLLKRISLM